MTYPRAGEVDVFGSRLWRLDELEVDSGGGNPGSVTDPCDTVKLERLAKCNIRIEMGNMQGNVVNTVDHVFAFVPTYTYGVCGHDGKD